MARSLLRQCCSQRTKEIAPPRAPARIQEVSDIPSSSLVPVEYNPPLELKYYDQARLDFSLRERSYVTTAVIGIQDSATPKVEGVANYLNYDRSTEQMRYVGLGASLESVVWTFTSTKTTLLREQATVTDFRVYGLPMQINEYRAVDLRKSYELESRFANWIPTAGLIK